MSDPKQDSLSVIAGTDLVETYYLWDDDTGLPVDWTDGTWQVEMELQDRSGQAYARIANFGSRDGDVTLSDGELTIELTGEATAALPITRTPLNTTDPRVVAYRHRNPLFFTLVATETTSGDVSDLIVGTLVVHQP